MMLCFRYEGVCHMWKKYAHAMKPVWTLTWVELTRPSFKRARQEPHESDIYFNKQLAIDFIREYGRKNMLQWVEYMKEYLETPNLDVSFYIYNEHGHTHKIHCSYKEMVLFLTFLSYGLHNLNTSITQIERNWLFKKQVVLL